MYFNLIYCLNDINILKFNLIYCLNDINVLKLVDIILVCGILLKCHCELHLFIITEIVIGKKYTSRTNKSVVIMRNGLQFSCHLYIPIIIYMY